MDCPVCKNAMITFELEAVEVDSCLECKGIWLDTGELEMLLGDETKANELLESFTEAKGCKEKQRKCPICLKKMYKILAGPGEKAKLIDKCLRGHGLWFDEGELGDIISMGSFDGENKVGKLLSEIFKGETK